MKIFLVISYQELKIVGGFLDSVKAHKFGDAEYYDDFYVEEVEVTT